MKGSPKMTCPGPATRRMVAYGYGTTNKIPDRLNRVATIGPSWRGPGAGPKCRSLWTWWLMADEQRVDKGRQVASS